jgi:hypothetical protein
MSHIPYYGEDLEPRPAPVRPEPARPTPRAEARPGPHIRFGPGARMLDQAEL